MFVFEYLVRILVLLCSCLAFMEYTIKKRYGWAGFWLFILIINGVGFGEFVVTDEGWWTG